MVKINMSVTANSPEELVEALKNAGPNVHTFYGEVVSESCQPAATPEAQIPGQTSMDDLPPAEPETAEDKPKAPTPVYTKDQVRAELRKVMNAQGSDAMREILKKYGSEKLNGVPEADYPAIVRDVEEALKSAG